MTYDPWDEAGWTGWRAREAVLDVPAWLAAVASGGGRRSRHARSQRVATGAGVVFVKSYPAPGAPRARRAFVMARALEAAGFAAPVPLLLGTRGREGVLVTADAGGEELLGLVARLAGDDPERRRTKRAVLRRLGGEIARLHRAGFVHGDLVPPNLRWRDDAPVYLDNDRTRRGLLALGARRNLVQLGRFVVPGLSATDRLRVLGAYAAARGWDRRRRRRLAAWLVQKITQRRCAVDHIAPDAAARAGFRTLMQSGGPFDPERLGTEST
jgi:Lipopolysaccharide kinase (Kdo/WaaP) family